MHETVLPSLSKHRDVEGSTVSFSSKSIVECVVKTSKFLNTTRVVPTHAEHEHTLRKDARTFAVNRYLNKSITAWGKTKDKRSIFYQKNCNWKKTLPSELGFCFFPLWGKKIREWNDLFICRQERRQEGQKAEGRQSKWVILILCWKQPVVSELRQYNLKKTTWK